jgi:hypothetical protein
MGDGTLGVLKGDYCEKISVLWELLY